MKAIQGVLNKPLRPLGVLLPDVTEPALQNLLWKQVYVAIDPSNLSILHCTQRPREMTQSELVDRVISITFDNFREDEHTLLFGFKQGDGFETKNSFGKFGCKFPNWIVTYLKTPEWEALLNRIGDAAMTRLLRDLQLFYKQNKCFIQLNGKVFSKLVSTSARPKLAPLRMQLDELVKKKTMTGRTTAVIRNHVSKEKARKLALLIAGKGGGGKSKSARVRLARSWINATPLLQRLLQNHRRCAYNQLLKRAMLANTSQSDTEELLLSLKHRETPLCVVSAFVKSALRRIVPKPFWGSRRTRRRLLTLLNQQIVLSPHNSSGGAGTLFDERATLRALDTSSFSWLTGSRKRQCLVQFVRFLFTYLAKDLLCSRFVQLVSPHGKVAYFLHTAYQTHVVKEYLLDNPKQFTSVAHSDSVAKRIKSRGFGFVHPRFGLKKNRDRFRLIMNLSRKTVDFPKPANMYFRPAFHALSYELNETPELGGSFVQGFDLIYAKYLAFHRRLCALGTEQVRFYCVAVDVEKCFDTMQPGLVYEIAKQTLRCEEYALSMKLITFLDEGMRTIRTKRLQVVNPHDCDPISLLDEPKLDMKSSAFVCTDAITRQYVTRDKALGLISELLHHTYVDFGGSSGLQRMKQGVPQGAVLSTLLCRLYYGRFEKEELEEFTREEDGHLLMRFVDDFIFFTTCADTARRFQAKMELGNAKFNCYVNPNKLQTCGLEEDELVRGKWMPWCSLMFHSKTGAVRLNYSAKDTYSGARIQARKLGKHLRGTVRTKLHALLLDLEINSPQNVFVNLAQLFALCATRFVKYCNYQSACAAERRRRVRGWTEVVDLFRFCHALVRAKSPTQPLDLVDLECLGLLAFKIKLGRHQLHCSAMEEAYKASLTVRRRVFAQKRLDWQGIERAVRVVVAKL